jgi:hypothetical protein
MRDFSPGSDLFACAQLVEKADPERFRAIMTTPVEARAKLFPIFAMNVEVARAPWASQEEMIAEIRLQWWRDALEDIAKGQPARRHEVVTPLAQALTPSLAADLDALTEARRWDIYRDPFEDQAALDRYLDQTSGTLFWVAARSLGAADEQTVRAFGYAVGVAGWLRAVPELESRGRIPLLDGRSDGVRALAQAGLDRLGQARKNRAQVSREAAQALRLGWQAEAILRLAVKSPTRVARGDLLPSPVRDRATLAWQAATGRW